MDADNGPTDGQSRRERLALTLEDLSSKLRTRLLSSLRTHSILCYFFNTLTDRFVTGRPCGVDDPPRMATSRVLPRRPQDGYLRFARCEAAEWS